MLCCAGEHLHLLSSLCIHLAQRQDVESQEYPIYIHHLRRCLRTIIWAENICLVNFFDNLFSHPPNTKKIFFPKDAPFGGVFSPHYFGSMSACARSAQAPLRGTDTTLLLHRDTIRKHSQRLGRVSSAAAHTNKTKQNKFRGK